MRIDIHHHIHLLDLTLGDLIMEKLAALAATVAEVRTVQDSAVTLINGLDASLDLLQQDLVAAGVDVAAVEALRADLKASTDQLAAAVVANTPAEAPIDPQADPAPV